MTPRIDRLSLAGVLFGTTAILGAQVVEGADPGFLIQGPAALIVLLGTVGATLLSCREEELGRARRSLAEAFTRAESLRPWLPGFFCELAFSARKEGLVDLDENEMPESCAFGRRAIRGLVDGCDGEQLSQILWSDALARKRDLEQGAHVFEIAGGYAPTMGILGAVLGLIQAMDSLSNPEELGSGIATAFIATLYGVGLANLLLLPVATKIRGRARQTELEDEMIIEGTLGVQAGTAPRMLERQLNAHLSLESSE